MNYRWKRMIICAAVGVALALFMTIGGGFADSGIGLTIAAFFLMPIGVNIFYWGWLNCSAFIRRQNLFLVMSIGKWVAFYLIVAFLSCFVGYVAFPIAIVKAIKKQD